MKVPCKVYYVQSIINKEFYELIIVEDKKLNVYRIVNITSGTIWDNTFEKYMDAQEYILKTKWKTASVAYGFPN